MLSMSICVLEIELYRSIERPYLSNDIYRVNCSNSLFMRVNKLNRVYHLKPLEMPAGPECGHEISAVRPEEFRLV